MKLSRFVGARLAGIALRHLFVADHVFQIETGAIDQRLLFGVGVVAFSPEEDGPPSAVLAIQDEFAVEIPELIPLEAVPGHFVVGGGVVVFGVDERVLAAVDPMAFERGDIGMIDAVEKRAVLHALFSYAGRAAAVGNVGSDRAGALFVGVAGAEEDFDVSTGELSGGVVVKDRLPLEARQQHHGPGGVGDGSRRLHSGRVESFEQARDAVEPLFVLHRGERELPPGIEAARAPGRLPGFLHGGQQQCDECADDGDTRPECPASLAASAGPFDSYCCSNSRKNSSASSSSPSAA